MNAMRPLVCVLLLMTSGCMARRELAPIDELTLSVDATAVTAAALDEPLTAARALQIALAQNPEVRAALARLDAVEAERVQAGLLRNPMLSLMAMRPDGGGRLAVTASWMQSLFDLLTRSRRVALADADARRARADVALRLLDVGWQAQTAFHEAVAAIARVRLLQSELALDTQALDLQTRWAQRGLSSQADTSPARLMRHVAAITCRRLRGTNRCDCMRLSSFPGASTECALPAKSGNALTHSDATVSKRLNARSYLPCREKTTHPEASPRAL